MCTENGTVDFQCSGWTSYDDSYYIANEREGGIIKRKKKAFDDSQIIIKNIILIPQCASVKSATKKRDNDQPNHNSQSVKKLAAIAVVFVATPSILCRVQPKQKEEEEKRTHIRCMQHCNWLKWVCVFICLCLRVCVRVCIVFLLSLNEICSN